MGKWLKWAALAALVALPRASLAREYANICGSAFAPAINDTITPLDPLGSSDPKGLAFTAESTVVFQAAGWREITLYLRVFPAGTDTVNNVRLAVLPKCLPDSNGVIPSIPASIDTFAAGIQSPSYANGFGPPPPPPGTGQGLEPGEFVISVDPWSGRTVGAGGTQVKSNRFFGLTTWRISLCSPMDQIDRRCALMQVRIRCLSYVPGSATTKPKVQAWVGGSN